MDKEVTIWTSEPDYEQYRKTLEEDYPGASDAERQAIFMEANDASLKTQRDEMSLSFGRPILAFNESKGDAWTVSSCSSIHSGNLADCFHVPAAAEFCRWYVDKKGDLRAEFGDELFTCSTLYRLIRSDLSNALARAIEDRFLMEKLPMDELLKYTVRLGEAIDKVYGISLND